jgi:hypothetical protein
MMGLMGDAPWRLICTEIVTTTDDHQGSCVMVIVPRSRARDPFSGLGLHQPAAYEVAAEAGLARPTELDSIAAIPAA